jgi:hypothetical protein
LDDHEKIGKLVEETEEYLGMKGDKVVNFECKARLDLIACAKSLVEASDGPVCPY